MNIYLLRSPEYDKAEYHDVIRFLTSFEGPFKFFPTEDVEELDDIDAVQKEIDRTDFYRMISPNRMVQAEALDIPRTVNVATWEDLFEWTQMNRRHLGIPRTDFVILLTSLNNEYNWFSASAPSKELNGFVHTAQWKHYVRSSATFPVAYLVVSLVLQRLMFSDVKELLKGIHQHPLGCFNDYCQHKKEIILKLRTADICSDCLAVLKTKTIPTVIQQVLEIFEAVRVRMLFSHNFKQTLQPSRLFVKQGRIFLPDYGNIEIRLTPLEKTLYLFFLNHPEGVMLHSLVDHRKELRQLYGRFTNSGMLTEVHSRIEELVSVINNGVSEKISKIKAAFVKALGKDLADFYIIKGPNGHAKRVELNHQLLFIVE